LIASSRIRKVVSTAFICTVAGRQAGSENGRRTTKSCEKEIADHGPVQRAEWAKRGS